MSTSQVLDRTFYLYRRNFVLFAGISVLPPGLMLLGQLAMLAEMRPLMFPNIGSQPDPATVLPGMVVAGLGFLVLLVLALVGYAFASGASVCAVSRVHLGESISITEAYRLLRPHFGNILGIIVLLGLGALAIFILAVLLIVLPIASGTFRTGRVDSTAMIFAFFVGFLLVIAGAIAIFFLSAKFALAVPSCVLENLGVTDSIKRSWNLTEGTFWRLILVFFLTAVMSTLLSMVLSIPYFVGVALTVTRKDPSFLTPFLVWQYIAEFLSRTLAFPVSTIAAAVIYYDQRVRKEAFDLQLMMAAIGPSTPPPPLSIPAAPGQG